MLKNRTFIWGMICLGVLFCVPACGIKAPPFIPKKEFKIRVEDLEGGRKQEAIILTGTIAGFDKGALPEFKIKGCRVYTARYPLDNPPCPTCPVTYHGTHDLGPEVVSGTKFLGVVPMRGTGQIYYFAVRLIGPDGEMGPPSNRAEITVR